MLLKLQRDESLRSYVERNKFIDPKSSFVESLDKWNNCSWGSDIVALIAKSLGWAGCYGFNKLLHNHTHAPWLRVFKSRFNHTYSESEYVSSIFGYDDLIECRSYCPLCVREDIQEFGYSYWRRIHHKVTVCAKHNVGLLSYCQFCGKPFARRGHAVHVMWSGCSGRHLGDAEPVVNRDPIALRLAHFYRELCSVPHHISGEVALHVTKERISKLYQAGIIDVFIYKTFEGFKSQVVKRGELAGTQVSYSQLTDLIELVALSYEVFEEFWQECAWYEPSPAPIDSCWNAYQIPGVALGVFIQEDYRLGVARWSYFKEHTSCLVQMADWGNRRPVIYPCCNLPIPRRKGHQLQPARVGKALPKVPNFVGARWECPIAT
ncbi:TniQ family protein [Pseudomonas sp. AP-1]|uniref:TniQ family protein n=1 Tax=Pseudomonas TaxID=286 RepID=UPI00040E2742